MPVEAPNIGIPPTLTYGNFWPESMYQHALTSSINSDSTDGGGGKRRSARPAARKSATATRHQVRDQDAGLSDEEEGEGNDYDIWKKHDLNEWSRNKDEATSLEMARNGSEQFADSAANTERKLDHQRGCGVRFTC
ncbi:hypothetical protein JB92DRAFT_2833319 [Gautieria morchelliformis]|nr:hypothetical protein JB92DRAFT_2833319 [Gautieria morchelliformis]